MLDLITKELDSQGLAAGRREDVHDPSPDGELAALIDPLDTLVAGAGEFLRDLLEP